MLVLMIDQSDETRTLEKKRPPPRRNQRNKPPNRSRQRQLEARAIEVFLSSSPAKTADLRRKYSAGPRNAPLQGAGQSNLMAP
jgi:hypothetical protein